MGLKGLRGVVGVAVGVAVWYVVLPPRAQSLPPVPTGLTTPVRGVIHAHTARSDGTGSVEQLASAAARAGLQFVIVTDHGDGTREPDVPAYHSGVLCIDGIEVSTSGGHLVALGLPRAPYPLGGNSRDVIADVARLGGFSVAAHPGSVRAPLSWDDWEAPFGGLEWINADSEWRDEDVWSLTRFLLTFPARRPEALARLLDRPATLKRWDALTRRRRVVAMAAADAHARLGLRTVGDGYEARAALPLPSYESVFRVFSIAVAGVTLSGQAAADAEAVIGAIREGRLYSTIDALGGPAAFVFTAASGSQEAESGQILSLNGPISFKVSVQAPPSASVVLLKDGVELTRGAGERFEYTAPPDRGAYRAEVRLSGAPGEPPVPWIVSNPIYAGYAKHEPVQQDSERPAVRSFPVPGDPEALKTWSIEKSEASAGAIDGVRSVNGAEVRFRWALAGARSQSPYVAMRIPAVSTLDDYDRLTFVGRANRPMRLSVQLRRSNGGSQERWQRSIYLDSMPRDVTVAFDDMTIQGFATQPRPVLLGVDSVLFVIDTVNTSPGSNGYAWLNDLRYAR